VICGAEGWSDVEDFGHAKQSFFREYLPFLHGIPSDDTFRHFFRVIDSDCFSESFINWVRGLEMPLNNSVIVIDGNTSRRSHDGDNAQYQLSS